MIKGAIFDLDGTLIESMGLWHTLGERYLKSIGITPPPDLRKMIWEMTIWEASEYFIEKFNLNDTPENVVDATYKLINDAYRYEIQAKPGAIALLDALSNANIPICLATATDRDIFTPTLSRLGFDKYFCYTRSCKEAGEGKTSPKIFLDCAEFLELNPDEIVVFEDTLHAAASAKRAGFKLCGVRDFYAACDYDGLIKICDKFVDSLEDLIVSETSLA